MKKISRILSFVIAVVIIVGTFPVTVNALKLQNYDYKFPGASSIARDVENGTEPAAAAYFDSTEKYSGDYSLKIKYEDGPVVNKEFRVNINMYKLKQDTDYRISFMLKADNMKALTLTITNQSNWWQLGNVLGQNFNWMPVDLEFTYPSASVNAAAVFIVPNACDGIWIDDLKLYEKGSDGSFAEVVGAIENGGFDDPGNTPTITAGDVETDEAAEKQIPLTDDDAIIVNEAKNIKIDGDASEWESYNSTELHTWYPLVPGDVSLEANIKYAYDDEALYWLVQAEDDTHKYVEGSTYWQGDGIQAAVDNNSTNGFGEPFGMYYNEEEDRLVFISDNGGAEMDTSAPDSVKGAAKRNGTTTTYEVKIPWSQTGAAKPDKVKFNLILNDNDTGVRKGWLEISEGIGQYKSSAPFPYMYLGEKGGGIVSAELVESQIHMGEKFKCDISYSNVRRSEVEISIACGGEVKEVTVAPMTKYVYTVEFDDFDDVGGYDKIITIDDGEKTEIEVVGSILPDDAFADKFCETLMGWISELKEMRDECTKRGIPTDYENADIRLLERYAVTSIPDLKGIGEYSRIAHIYDVLPGVYEECRESLRAILAGEKETVSVPKYVTSEIKIRDGAYWSTVEKDGIQYESPITFNGICSFLAPEYYTDDFWNYGFNHSEVGVYSFMMIEWNGKEFVTIPEEERIGKRSDEYAWERVIEQLENCEKNGISVSLGVSAMAWPHMDEYGFSDYKHSTNHSYNPFNVNHPMVAVVADAVYKEIGKLCERYECIDSICMLNEPTVKLAGNPYYDGQWAEFLTNRYNGDIEWLNKVYGEDANYKDFTEIEMPSTVSYGVPVYHDYRMFCEDVYNQFLEVLSTAARKYTDVKLCVKEMQRTRLYNSDYTINMATTIEKNKEYIDLAGCDAFFVRSNNQLSLDVKMMWYDYITSVMETPVQNGEDHIGSDGQGGVEGKFWDDNSYKASTWQGMIHGGGAQAIWYYAENERAFQQGDGKGGEFEPAVNMIQLPNSLRDSYRNNLDGMRLAYEVNALYTAPRNVGILWANTNWGYNAKHMNGLYRAYNNAIYNGQRVRFVTEHTLEQLDKVKMLVIPGTTHILPETLEAIKKYAENGGKVVMLGKDCLSFDDYNQPTDKAATDFIRSRATIIESDVLASGGSISLPENYDEIMTGEYAKLGLMDVVLKDAETGEKVEGVEWIFNDLNGKTIINPFNYNTDGSKTVEIWINGEKVERFTDLKGQKTYNGEITLESHEPYLIEVGGEDVFTDISHVGWAKEAIYGLRDEGVINGVGNRKFAPDLSVKREELVKMLTASLKLEIKDAEIPFNDVDKSQWYAPFVMTAFAEGITEGISENEFGIGDAVTRQDLAVMTYRAAANAGILSTKSDLAADFADSAEISDYAKEAVAELRAAGIINGDENDCFNPKVHCTRAEAAKIIYNIFYK